MSFEGANQKFDKLTVDEKLDLTGGASPTSGPAVFERIQAKTSAYSCLYADSGTIFTNTGATGSVTFTLPPIYKGWNAKFIVTADQDIVVAAATADTLIAFNDAEADSVSYATSSQKLGNAFEIHCDGSKYVALPLGGVTNWSATVTIAT